MNKNLFQSAKITVENQNSSPSFLFSQLELSYPDILKLMNELELKGVLGPYNPENESREVLIKKVEDLKGIFPDNFETNSTIVKDQEQLQEDLNAKKVVLENMSSELQKREQRVNELEEIIANKSIKNSVIPPSHSNEQNVRNAPAVLTLGILSIIFIWCYGIVGLILAIISLSISAAPNREYNENPSMYSKGSYSQLKAGRICSQISIWILIIVFILIVALAG